MDFKILLEKIKPALKSIARKNVLMGFHDQDDLYQQMSMYLWQRFSGGLPIGINEAYAIKACEFYLLNFLRKGRRMPYHLSMDTPISDTELTLKDTIPSGMSESMGQIESHISIDEIKRKNLTQREQEVLDLLLKGNTVREIASVMGISHVMVVKYKKNIIKKSKSDGYQK